MWAFGSVPLLAQIAARDTPDRTLGESRPEALGILSAVEAEPQLNACARAMVMTLACDRAPSAERGLRREGDAKALLGESEGRPARRTRS